MNERHQESIRLSGLDITAADMVPPPLEPSKIQDFFAGCTVFMTGATGCLGQLTLEKLLRACPDISRIYVLIRKKKGKSDAERFNELFQKPIFDGLKRKTPGALEKVHLVAGDCCLKDLGLDQESKRLIMEEVNCVLHFAATIRFDQTLKQAVRVNVRATRDLLKIAKEMKKLKVFVYCSTAYSFCPKKEVGEEIYELKVKGDDLLDIVEKIDEETLDAITPKLITPWPNTYTFTKAAAEDVIRSNSSGLPITIVRPSIVIGTYKEPLAGYTDSIFGIVSVTLGVGMGILRILPGKGTCTADLVPADYVTNCALAAAWFVGKENDIQNFESVSNKNREIVVVNYVSSTQNKITWGMYGDLGYKLGIQVPLSKAIRNPSFHFIENEYLETICDFFSHRVPAYLIDVVLEIIGKKPVIYSLYKKFRHANKLVSYFTLNEWKFKDKNRVKIWESMNATDKELFDFDMSVLNWENIIEVYFKGGRVYLLRDPLDTIPSAIAKRKILLAVDYGTTLLMVVFFYYLLVWMYSMLFG